MRQVAQNAPPMISVPPARFELFSEADQSASFARLGLFETNFPAEIIILLERARSFSYPLLPLTNLA